MQKASLPKGTRDFSTDVMRKRKQIIATIEDVYIKYGFDPIETPAMENLSTLTGKYGEEGDTLLFKILNSGDYLAKADRDAIATGDSSKLIPTIANKGLRYDLTVPFARFVVQNQSSINFPFRRYQMQPVWRADRPQKGRYREFWQCDADVIGTTSLLCEADFIKIYDEVFRALGLNTYQLKLNNRKILEAISETIGFTGTFTDLTVAIDKLDKIGWDGVAEELSTKGVTNNALERLKELLVVTPFDRDAIEALTDVLIDCPQKAAGIQELSTVLDFIEGYDANVSLDLTLARGLDYYTGCIFEAIIPESGIGSVSGGGRYDNLTGIFGLQDVSGVGISFGLDRIYDVMTKLDLFDDEALTNKVLFCHFDDAGLQYALPICDLLRTKNIVATVYPDRKKINKQFDYANKSGYKWVAVIGSNEMEENSVQLKNMATGKQELVKISDIVRFINEA